MALAIAGMAAGVPGASGTALLQNPDGTIQLVLLTTDDDRAAQQKAAAGCNMPPLLTLWETARLLLLLPPTTSPKVDRVSWNDVRPAQPLLYEGVQFAHPPQNVFGKNP